MKPKLYFIVTILILLFLLAGCTLWSRLTGGGELPTPIAVATLVVPTVDTATPVPGSTVTATVAVSPTTGASTATVVPPTAVPPTTVPPTAAPPTAIPPTTAPGACTNAALFVSDVTVPDGTAFAPSTGFVKTWRIRNNGTCTWDNRYQLVHAGRDLLGAIASSFPLPSSVAPGQTIDLSVSLISPAAAGSYQSDWVLSSPQGARFGLGRSNSPMWAKITVNQTAANGSIIGYVWQDRDLDNVVDANEYLPNIAVALSSGTECRTANGSTTSDANGRFQFAGLAAGSYCLSGTDGTVTIGISSIALAANQQLTNVAITWPPLRPDATTIAGLVYQDLNNNGSQDAGEPAVANREVWLIASACQVSAAPVAIMTTAADGVFTFKGEHVGTFCVGLPGPNGLEDVVSVTVTAGQVIDNLRLHVSTATASISGFVWSDYCSAETGIGNCVPSDSSRRADGMIQPTETNIAGVTVKLFNGACTPDVSASIATAVTAGNGRYDFTGLEGGTYCIYINATDPENVGVLVPGDWTFPGPGIRYQEITMVDGDEAYPVNFGWDYQLD